MLTTSDVASESYEVLAQWLYVWEKLIDNPNQLLLDRSFGNVLRATTSELAAHVRRQPGKPIQRSNKGVARNLLEILEKAFKRGDGTINFIKAEQSAEVDELNRLLKEGEFNPEAILIQLRAIADAPSFAVLEQEFTKEILQGEGADNGRLKLISSLLIRKLLINQGARTLKELPRRSLARHGARASLERHALSIAAEERLSAGLWREWLQYLIGKTSPDDLSRLIAGEPASIFDLSKRYFWLSLMHRFMRRTAEACASEVKGSLAENKVDAAGDGAGTGSALLELGQEAQLRIGGHLVRHYISAFLRFVFDTVADEDARREDSEPSRMCRELGDFLIAKAGFTDNSPRPDDHRPNVVDLVTTEAFVSTASSRLGERLADAFRAPILDTVAADVARKLTDALKEEFEVHETDFSSIVSAEVDIICFHLSARRRVHEEMGRALAPLNELLIKETKRLLEELQPDAFDSLEERGQLWGEWANSFSQYAASYAHIFHHLPWGAMKAEDIEQILGGFFRDLSRPHEEWMTIFVIKDVDPQGKIWTLDDVTFYDPASFDFGENRWFRKDVAERATFAKLIVKADTQAVAIQQGWSRLNDMLSAFVFSLSADQNWGGFKPELHRDVYVAQMATGNWAVTRSNVRDDRPVVQSIGHLKHFAPTFRHLLQEARDPSHLTGLQAKLLKSLHWYRKGRWKTDPVESFLFYWIGLEHLFEEDDQDRLSELLPRLHITWRNVPVGWYFLKRHQLDVIKMVEGDAELKGTVDADNELENWNRDQRILLSGEKVARLIDHVPTEKEEIKKYVESYRDYLQGFIDDREKIINEVERLREVFRFKLLLLKALRNDMVHKALPYSPEASIYAEELEDVLEDVIGKVGDDAIQPASGCNSIKDLIEQYEEIWI